MKTSKHYKETLQKLPKLSKAQLDEMHQIEKDAFARYTGTFQELESAIGLLRIGHYVGWKTLLIIHNKRTIKKYEEILNINIRDYFPEVGTCADLSIGYRDALKMGNFWKIVSGDIKIQNRKEIG